MLNTMFELTYSSNVQEECFETYVHLLKHRYCTLYKQKTYYDTVCANGNKGFNDDIILVRSSTSHVFAVVSRPGGDLLSWVFLI